MSHLLVHMYKIENNGDVKKSLNFLIYRLMAIQHMFWLLLINSTNRNNGKIIPVSPFFSMKLIHDGWKERIDPFSPRFAPLPPVAVRIPAVSTQPWFKRQRAVKIKISEGTPRNDDAKWFNFWTQDGSTNQECHY